LKVLRGVAEARAWRATAGRVGLVPTMGALHAGHASLIARAARECEAAAVSIFVNPTQFGPNEDYAAYPRAEAADLALCERLGAAMVFAPGVDEMYPPGDTTLVQPGPIAARLEGAGRPGHFTGVATVVAKLFAITRPDVAFFGQKDFQQLRVIQTMTRDLRLGIRIVGCPIVRDPDGLAMSSRNVYLDPMQRAVAPSIHNALDGAANGFRAGVTNPAELEAIVSHLLEGTPGVAIDYVALVDQTTLRRPERAIPGSVLAVAVKLGSIRLIDNVVLGAERL
jgi:pantoate--beta-alanine ligase